MARLEESRRREILFRSFREIRNLGFDYNLAPSIDVNSNPSNPDIGAIGRSYSADINVVRGNAEIAANAAKQSGLGLCLKHYPGLGGAQVNSHLDLTDLSDAIDQAQLELFFSLGRTLPGQAVLISHGIVRQWDPRSPISMSHAALSEARRHLPNALFISDDLQMQGLQKQLDTMSACSIGFAAGLDMLCVGNNLMQEDSKLLEIAANLEKEVTSKEALQQRFDDAYSRISDRKDQFKK